MTAGRLRTRPRTSRRVSLTVVVVVLLANLLSEPVPAKASAPFQATFYSIQGHVAQHLVAGSAALWFIDEAQGLYGLVRRFDRATQVITTAWAPPAYNRVTSLGSACLEALAIAPDQALWAADQCDNLIARVDAGNGTVSTFNVGLGRIPTAMTWGPNNHLWLLQEYAGITEFDPSTGLSTPHSICPTLCGTSPIFGEPRDSIITGPDGNLWFSDGAFQFVGTMTPLGQVAACALPAGHKPEQLTIGPGGAIWFTETGTSSLGRVTMSGTVSEFALPASQFAYGIVSAADSHVWYVGGANVGRVDPTTGTVEDFSPLGTIAYNPTAVAADGTIWFAASNNGTVPTILANFSPASGRAAGFTSTLTITTINAPTGNYVLILTGTDGRPLIGGTRTAILNLTILTPAQAIPNIIDAVNALKAAGVLNKGQAHSLIVKLQHAIDSLNSKPDQPTACNQLQAFVNEVNAYVRSGKLTPAQGDQLLGGPLGIYAIMASIPC